MEVVNQVLDLDGPVLGGNRRLRRSATGGGRERRCVRQQAARIGALRMAQKLQCRALLLDAAALHDDEAMRAVGRHAQVVGDQ